MDQGRQGLEWLLLAALGSIACSSSLPRPPLAEHPPASYVDVPYPPPAALAEVVPDRPPMDAVWLDGDWAIRPNGYAWVRGGWVTAPDNVAYAASRVFYTLDGRIMFAPAGWYKKNGEKIEHIEPVVPARTPTNEYTAESQTAR